MLKKYGYLFISIIIFQIFCTISVTSEIKSPSSLNGKNVIFEEVTTLRGGQDVEVGKDVVYSLRDRNGDSTQVHIYNTNFKDIIGGVFSSNLPGLGYDLDDGTISTKSITENNGYLYINLNNDVETDRLEVYDVRNPDFPSIIGNFTNFGGGSYNPTNVFAEINKLFAVWDNGTLGIYDTSDPSDLSHVGSTEIADFIYLHKPPEFYRIPQTGNNNDLYYLFYQGNENDYTNDEIIVVNVTDFSNPSVVNYIDSYLMGSKLHIQGDLLFTGDSYDLLSIYDISDVTNIIKIGSYTFNDYLPNDFTTFGNYLFAAVSDTPADDIVYGVTILDLNNINNIVEIGNYTFSQYKNNGWNFFSYDIEIVNNFILISEESIQSLRVLAFDILTETVEAVGDRNVLIDYSGSLRGGEDLEFGEGVVYTLRDKNGDNTQITVYKEDMNNQTVRVSHIQHVGYDQDDNKVSTLSLTEDNGYLYVNINNDLETDRLEVYDVRNTDSLTLINNLTLLDGTGKGPIHMTAKFNKLYAVWDDGDVNVFDVSDPTANLVLNVLGTSSIADSIKKHDQPEVYFVPQPGKNNDLIYFAYAGDHSSTPTTWDYIIANFTDLSSISVADVIQTSIIFSEDYFHIDSHYMYAPLISDPETLGIYDISDPSSVTSIGSYHLPDNLAIKDVVT
ncbi:MAG: hypothetical protein ACXAC7_09615, partial [Candidatus Hodarchaeales archaeon]